MLRALMKKVDNMQEQMGNESREIKTLRKNQKEMLEIKRTVTEIENVFDGFISRPDTVEDSVRFKIVQEKYFKLKCQEQKEKKYQTEHPRTWDNFQSCNIHVIGILEGEEREKRGE